MIKMLFHEFLISKNFVNFKELYTQLLTFKITPSFPFSSYFFACGKTVSDVYLMYFIEFCTISICICGSWKYVLKTQRIVTQFPK